MRLIPLQGSAVSMKDELEAAWKSYDDANYADMVAHASRLVLAGNPWAGQGHFLRGMAYENWEGGPEDRLRLAVNDYRRTAILAPHGAAYQNLARVLMKMGAANYDEAYRHLLEASAFGQSPELMLGFGKYFLTKPDPEPGQALMFYRRAALRGRFRGFIAAAQVCRSMDKPLQGALWSLARIVLAPLVWLTQGRRAMYEF